jgi:RimJ/RimL family protein N-acetyltransferase
MGTVYLRSLEVQDIERTHKWHNDPEVYQTLIGSFHYVSMVTEGEWLRNKASYSPYEVNLAICLSSSSVHIGNIYIRNIDWTSRHGELHILIGSPEHRSKGYGQEAVRLLIHYAFNEIGLNRLHLLVLADHQAAIHVYEKCGFVIEGRLRRHIFKAGVFKDALLMGLCVGDPGLAGTTS